MKVPDVVSFIQLVYAVQDLEGKLYGLFSNMKIAKKSLEFSYYKCEGDFVFDDKSVVLCDVTTPDGAKFTIKEIPIYDRPEHL